MIRNVVMGQLREASDSAAVASVEAALDGIRGLSLPGQLAVTIGRDLGLREGGWDFAIVSDWADADAYRTYDTDPEHNTYRAQIVAGCAQVARVQFDVPD